MRFRRWLPTVLSTAALLLPSAPAQSAGAPAISTHRAATTLTGPRPATEGGKRPGPGRPTDDRQEGLCRPGVPANAPSTTRFHDDDPLLGPAELAEASPVGPLLSGYRRFGALTKEEFLDQYAGPARDGYVYPPGFGFVIAPDGRPIRTAQQLLPGYRLDRFGFPGGMFLAPLGTPFGSRSLPPTNLRTPSDAPLSNYHVYCVLRPFTVDAGPTAPWFAQVGMGTQYKLEARYLPEAGALLSVTWLVQHGYLVEEDLDPAVQPAGTS